MEQVGKVVMRRIENQALYIVFMENYEYKSYGHKQNIT